MKTLFSFLFLGIGILLQGADTVKVSSFGFDEKNSTSFLQKAIDSGAKRVIIDNVGKPWFTETLTLRSDLELIFADGSVLKALPGSFHQRTAFLLKLDDVKNVTLRGEGKALIEMNKKDYQNPKLYQWSEWRHAVSLRGAHNIRIENLTIKGSGGDGIYVGQGKTESRNILIDKVICEDHHRQGISVISVDGLTIRNSSVNSTAGTPPQAGIDIEPNRFTNSVRKILVENCEFSNNTSAGFMIHLGGPDKLSDITIRNCRMINNRIGFQRDVAEYNAVAHDRAALAKICERADRVSYVREHYSSDCMHARNRAMVDGSDLCVAYCTSSHGGTAYTLLYAKKEGVEVLMVE